MRAMFSVTLPIELKQELESRSKREDRSQAEIIEEALKKLFANTPKKKFKKKRFSS